MKYVVTVKSTKMPGETLLITNSGSKTSARLQAQDYLAETMGDSSQTYVQNVLTPEEYLSSLNPEFRKKVKSRLAAALQKATAYVTIVPQPDTM